MSYVFYIPKALLELPKGTKEGSIIDWTDTKVREQAEYTLTVNLATELDINPHDIFKHIRVALGQRVKDGEIIAEKKTFFTAHFVKSPVEGEIRSINHSDGTMALVTEHTLEIPFALKAKYKGINKEQYEFQASEGHTYQATGIGLRTFGGVVSYIDDSSDISPEQCENKVVVTPLSSKMILSKIVALGPMALVTERADYHQSDNVHLIIKEKSDWTNLLEKKWPMAIYIEGAESIHFYKP